MLRFLVSEAKDRRKSLQELVIFVRGSLYMSWKVLSYFFTSQVNKIIIDNRTLLSKVATLYKLDFVTENTSYLLQIDRTILTSIMSIKLSVTDGQTHFIEKLLLEICINVVSLSD